MSKFPLRNRIFGRLYFLSVGIGAFILAPLYGMIFCRGFRNIKRLNAVGAHFFIPVFRIFGIRLVTEGRENIPQGRGFVIVANHQSFLDINGIFPGVAASAFLAKEDLWKIPIFNRLLNYNGSIPVHRGMARSNTRIGAQLKDRVDRGFVFTVFPEGKRSEDGILLPFKNGIFHMAKEYQYVLLPVSLLNTGHILPKRGMALFPGELKIVIHPPVEPSQYESMSVESLRDNIRSTILSSLPQKTEEAKEA